VARTDELTLREAADRLGVHYMTVYGYVRTGRLDARREGPEWRVRAGDVSALQRSTRVHRRRSLRAPAPRLAARLLAGDEAGSWRIVDAALRSGRTPEAVHLEITIPALHDIGRQWEEGRIGIAEEHRASVVAARLVARLGPSFSHRGRGRGAIVLGCVAGERHGLASALLADLLRGRRCTVVDLGADTPAASFVDAAQRADRLLAVLVGAMSPGHEQALAAAADALRAAGIDAPCWFGGPGVESVEAARHLGADGWTGPDARSALDAVEARLGVRP
jgi:excisionase family DNA binding protein